ncbi:VIT1/CCC1 transporter family protein, partial [Nonomuraea sp. SBT364]|uniref:VIT1/CCC1 transporter family protein n=1 Tax=Nonomuraea sp. SBT364 TaxID=1580530 RepID=UPI002F4196C1
MRSKDGTAGQASLPFVADHADICLNVGRVGLIGGNVMTIELERTYSPEKHHSHRDVTGGWLRPAVFGAMDGLVSNFALIAGVVGAAAGRPS